jgi:hypothetical protein
MQNLAEKNLRDAENHEEKHTMHMNILWDWKFKSNF